MENKNFLNIQGWMVKELKLSGNELLCYALIYGFSQDGQSVFSGSSKYIQEWLNISIPTVFAVLKKLCEKGLIEKIEKVVNGCHLCDYKITLDPLKKFNGGTKEILEGGTKETLDHNNNNIENKEKNTIKKGKRELREVPLDWQPSEETKMKLYSRGIDWAKATEEFILACQAKGYKYKNFDAAILKWDWSRDMNKVEKTRCKYL